MSAVHESAASRPFSTCRHFLDCDICDICTAATIKRPGQNLWTGKTCWSFLISILLTPGTKSNREGKVQVLVILAKTPPPKNPAPVLLPKP
jgi:hypothetical protein